MHVYTGELDTFYLEGAVKLLKERMEQLGTDAAIEIVPGKDHGSLLSPEMFQRLDREMAATLARTHPELLTGSELSRAEVGK